VHRMQDVALHNEGTALCRLKEQHCRMAGCGTVQAKGTALSNDTCVREQIKT
jgi:hypothetical protein